MKRLSSIMLAAICSGFFSGAWASVPEGYYDTLTGLNGSRLRKAAKAIVRDHTVVSYGDNTWDAFKSTDTRFVNGQNCWWDMYSYDNVTVASGHPGMDIEHSVANSWWGGSKNDAYKDLFHLNPSNSDANSRKSNYPLGEVSTVKWTNGATTVGTPVYGQGGGNGYVYEPCDEYKGDFARVFMYMFTVYDDINWDSAKGWMFDKANDDIFKPWAIELLLKWHRQDPVSEKEIARNEAIYKIQHNRNPYIDSPELAEFVWGAYKDQGYQYGGEYVPVEPVEPVDPVDPTDPSDPQPTNGEWIRVLNIGEINEIDSYVLIGLGDRKTTAMSVDYKSTNTSGYLLPTDQVTLSGDKVADLPDNTAVLHFVKSGADYKAKITDLKGTEQGWLSCTAEKKLQYANASTDANTSFSLSVSASRSDIGFGSTFGTLNFNESSPRFTTYAKSPQKPTALFRKSDEATGVGSVESADSAVAPRIFTLQGVEVNASLGELTPGIYILVTPGQPARKIIKQ